MADEPLGHLTVVDFSRYRAGPWCTQILSELGAEVIKVERPGVGDPERHSHPEQGGMGVNFIARNRNKKSIAVNLKHEEGRQVVEDLVADADVLVENYSLGVMEEFGLGYEYLTEEVNPDLVYASVKGYGEEGPDSDRRGVDLVMQAEGGIMSVTGPEDGQPVKLGQALGDIGSGLYALVGVLTALYERERAREPTAGAGEGETGGQKVETNLFGTIVSFMEEYITRYGITGEDPTPYGTRHQTGVPYELFETADGHMVLSVTGQGSWERFVTEVLEDADHLLEYDSQRLRQEHYAELMAVIRPKLREKTTAEWREIFDEMGFPNGPLNRVSDVVEHPQARARDYVFEYEDDEIGEVTLHGHPLHFSDADTSVRSGPPQLGEHTDAVLTEHLDRTPEEVDRLREDGAVE
jgi:crotonobetainyl-CoA:carnitine CoA-transferase CaiB-like acyl-CoA transferase